MSNSANGWLARHEERALSPDDHDFNDLAQSPPSRSAEPSVAVFYLGRKHR